MATYHPQIVHFVIALLGVGVVLRVISLLGRPAFVGPMATTLLLLGTTASVFAVTSGDAAHGPVERVPGSRPAVEEHEEWGIRTRNVFLGVAALELVALALHRSNKRTWAKGAAAALGLVGLGCLYEAGEHGGHLVYGYAGGVGIRSGDPKDVENLLLAGLYHQALQDRAQGRAADAAALMDLAARRFPSEPEVQLAAAESLLLDRKDPATALELLNRIAVPDDNRAARLRQGNLRVDALVAAGQREAAIGVLDSLLTAYPDNAALRRRLTELKEKPPQG
jgi:uncharacterized membrane protein